MKLLVDQVVNVEALVDLLDRRQPALLEAIRERHAAYKNMLQPGKMLGAVEDPKGRMLADLLATTVGVAKQESSITYQTVSRRLKTSARLRLGSSIVSATSSGGLIAALMHGTPSQALVAGVLAFVASAFMLVAQYVEEFAGGKDSIRAMRDRVVTHIAESAEVECELKLMEIHGNFDGAVPLIRRLNALVASLRQVQLAVS